MSELIAQIKHDFIIEYRSWPQTLSLLLFMWVLAYVIYRIRPEISSAEFNFVFWVFLLLVSVNVAVRSTATHREGERLMTYTLVPPVVILLSRIVFNVLYLVVVALAFYGAMLLLFYPQISFSSDYLLLILVGGVSIGSVLAFIAAISRHVAAQNTTLSILSIPLLIPITIILNSIGANLVMSNQLQGSKYVILLGITLLSIALSLILFPFIWKD